MRDNNWDGDNCDINLRLHYCAVMIHNDENKIKRNKRFSLIAHVIDIIEGKKDVQTPYKPVILQYFLPSLSYHLFCLFSSGCFTQILQYYEIFTLSKVKNLNEKIYEKNSVKSF